MSSDPYVRPPLVAREPLPRWVAVWRFRIIAALVAVGLAILTAIVVLHFVNTEQNPSFGTAPATGVTLPSAVTR